MILKPWDERKRSAQQMKPLIQAKINAVEGLSAFVFSLPPLPAIDRRLAGADGDLFDRRLRIDLHAMEKIKEAARKSGMFIVVDSDLDFNQPVIHVNIDRSKANELGVTMQSIGDTLALLVGENYVNRFNLSGRSYEVIPQVPRSHRLNADTLTHYYVKSAGGQIGAAVQSGHVSTTGIEPNALTQYNQLNSATFQAVPMPGRDDGAGGRFPRSSRPGSCRPALAMTTCPIRG